VLCDRRASFVPVFDQAPHHSSVPTNFGEAVARGGGQGRPQGRRARRALPLRAASAAACFELSEGCSSVPER
jgi:hypothetical protein